MREPRGGRERIRALLFSATALFTAVLVVGSGPLAAAEASEAPSAEEVAWVGEAEEFVESNMEEHGIPAVALSVDDGEQSRTLEFGEGVDENTQFAIGSQSKAFTALAILILVDEGHVELESPIEDYLSELEASESRAEEITVDMLVRMVSGYSDGSYPEDGPYLYPGMGRGIDSLAGAVEALNGLRPTDEPGEVFSYTNINYTLLARIVEVTSGTPYHEFLRTRIFAPLGMESTATFERTAELDDSAFDDLAPGYAQAFGAHFPSSEPDGYVVGAGDIVSTAGDMGRWASLFSGRSAGDPLVPPELLEEQMTPSEQSPYALGWTMYGPTDDLPPRVYGGGDMVVYHSDTVLVPEKDVAVSLLVNTNLAVAPVRMSLAYREMVTGLADIARGQPPNEVDDPIWASGIPRLTTVSEVVPAVMLALTLLGTFLGLRRARRKAVERSEYRWYRWIPGFVLLGVLALAPWGLLTLFDRLTGMRIGADFVFTAWPSLFLATIVIALASLVVLTARSYTYLRIRAGGWALGRGHRIAPGE